MIKINISKRLNMPNGASELVIDTELASNSITALYGRSGVGKTSLLKILAGLMQPEKGYIEVNGDVWFDSTNKINLPPQKRNIGFVFQDYALFPNMTVKQNLLYAINKNAGAGQIDHLLEITALKAFADHKPITLSGGQKQRVALARALVKKPSLLLLDEPLSAIDLESREQLQHELLQLHREYEFTALLVSHDVNEIFQLASHVFCIDNGNITKSGNPLEIFATRSDNNKLKLTGIVVATMDTEIDVLVDRKIITLKNTAGRKIGDTISLEFEQFASS